MTAGAYIIFAGLSVMAIFFLIVAYREDHPKKKK
jgi:hypothetical protein